MNASDGGRVSGRMQNLAGHPEASALARAELVMHGVNVVEVEPKGEVGSRYDGELNGFTFRRAWYYWIVKGPMPLEQAKALYADPLGARDVRVAGHCGCPPPEEWAEWRDGQGREIAVDPDGSEQAKFENFVERYPRHRADAPRWVRDLSEVPDARAFVTSYHVDSDAGLRLLTDTIRSLATPAVAA